MTGAFVFQTRIPRVVFGAGSLAQLEREVEALGADRALVLSTPGQRGLAERAAALLGSRSAGVHAEAVMHVPTGTIAAAMDRVRATQADAVIAIGGGSTTGLGKALARDAALPLVAVPTTYAGSEMTPMWGETADGVKRTGIDPRVVPRTVLYDPELSVGLPWGVTVTSALNAIAHAAEGLYAPDGSPLVALMAEDGIRRFAAALPVLQAAPRHVGGRGDALIGAWYCGAVMGAITVGLHHKLCHTLGGTFGLPHAELHAIILPHAMAYNASAAPDAMQAIARALGLGDVAEPLAAARGLHALAMRHGAPTALAAIGMPADGLGRAADLAVQKAYPNPRPLDRDAVRALLQRAFEGAAPA